jgi:hypothetical protein
VGIGAVDALEVTVDVGLLDWSKFARAFVFLEYTDSPNNVSETTQFRFDQTSSDQVKVWKVLLRDKTKRVYRFRLRLAGKIATDDRATDWTDSQDPFLLVR